LECRYELVSGSLICGHLRRTLSKDGTN
ncbi:MAG: hypothetical protein JWO20_1787, partial [Candidatus Angelobacter sp.]|nr:hypothetical protein [Candidatus Angelobacter sp.]